jgi:hypothetical protein
VQVTTYTFDTVAGSELCNSVWLDCTNYRIHDVTSAIWAANAPYKWFYLRGNNDGAITTNWRIDIVLYNCAKSVNCVEQNIYDTTFEIWYPNDEFPAQPLKCTIDGLDSNPNCDASTRIALDMVPYPTMVCIGTYPQSVCGGGGVSPTTMNYWTNLDDITHNPPLFQTRDGSGPASPYTVGFTSDRA